MYTQKNGIMYKDGDPILMIGTSYYPSFHKHKYPTPPDGDRLGEMRTDLAKMREFGFNQVRIAALAELSLDEADQVQVESEFIDEMIREAAKNELAVTVRLQGYVTNLRNNSDYLMRNQLDEPMEGKWSAFIVASLFHEGINRDTDEATVALAKHYAAFDNVLGLQTYNEPHYPFNGIFDYHPKTVAAYKKWLALQGLPEAEPPRKKPQLGEDASEWIRWRLFNMRAMSDFLNHAAELSVKSSGLESFTCATSGAGTPSIMDGGLSYFGIAEGMDVMGITTYVGLEGADFYTANYVFDLAESAAATFGKHAWTVEADARTHMPGRKTYQSVYTILGAGHKGINFYEWRGDYPAEETPLPDNCGFIFNDGSKSTHYDMSKKMLAFVNRHSTMLARCEKHRDGFGILFSEHSLAASDAFRTKTFNHALHDILAAYRDARKSGLSVDFTRGCDLEKNPLGVRVLIVPCDIELLSAEEKKQLRDFAALEGHYVYVKRTAVTFSGYCVGGFWELDRPIPNVSTSHFESNRELADILEETALIPSVRSDDIHLRTAVLDAEDYTVVSIVNTSTSERDIHDCALICVNKPNSAVFLSPESETECTVHGNRILLPTVGAGGFVVIR